MILQLAFVGVLLQVLQALLLYLSLSLSLGVLAGCVTQTVEIASVGKFCSPSIQLRSRCGQFHVPEKTFLSQFYECEVP